MTSETRTTQEVYEHHMQSIQGLVEKGADGFPDLLSDYASDAVLFSPQGVFEGEAGLRAFFEGMLPMVGSLMPQFSLQVEEIRGDTVYAVGSLGDQIPLITDTFIIRDGKIVTQTVALYIPS